MRRFFRDKQTQKPGLFKNWERDICAVDLEPCADGDDPSGYKAVFYLTPEAAGHAARNDAQSGTFSIGASLLEQRRNQIEKAGYKAPMTKKALYMAGKFQNRTDQKQPEEA